MEEEHKLLALLASELRPKDVGRHQYKKRMADAFSKVQGVVMFLCSADGLRRWQLQRSEGGWLGRDGAFYKTLTKCAATYGFTKTARHHLKIARSLESEVAVTFEDVKDWVNGQDAGGDQGGSADDKDSSDKDSSSDEDEGGSLDSAPGPAFGGALQVSHPYDPTSCCLPPRSGSSSSCCCGRSHSQP
jgi:hypothetical protein